MKEMIHKIFVVVETEQKAAFQKISMEEVNAIVFEEDEIQ